MKLKMESIKLRKFKESDAPAIRMALHDGRIARNTSIIPYPYPNGGEYEFISRSEGKSAWAVVGGEDNREQFFGVCGFNINAKGNHELGYWVVQEFWNRGIGTRTIELLMSKAPKGTIFDAGVFNDNPASKRVFEKLNFKIFGSGRQFSAARAIEVDVIYVRKS